MPSVAVWKRPAAHHLLNMPPPSPKRPARPAPQPRGFFRRYGLALFLLLVLAGGGAAYYFLFYDTVESAEVAAVQRGSALQGVYGTVDVEPVNEAIVRTRNFGMLSAVKFKAGDTVKTGEVLVETSDESVQRQVDGLNSALAQAKVRQALGPASAAALKNQEIEVEKLKKLLDANDISPVEYEKAQNLLTSLRDQVQKETLALNTDVENAERSRDAMNDQLGHDQITSPMDGVILDRYCNLGEYVPPQTQICRIGSAENQVVAQVNEEDVGYLAPGMKAKIRLYAHQDRDLVGTLKKILPQAENQVYRVLFSLDDPPAMLLPGMTGEMNIIIGERKNTLTIPSRAIRRGNMVLAVIDGRVREIHVRTGFHTLERTEILEGLDEGTEVILSNQDLYKPGVRVREVTDKQA
jgi:RND family efflux transporter MFP subunit